MSRKKEIDKNWLHQKYVVENRSWKEIAKIIGCSEFLIARHIKEYGFVKTSEQINMAREKTMLKRFKVKNAAHSFTLKNKAKKTNLKKYGVENPFQSEEIKSKIRETNLNRYGTENPSQSSDIKIKKLETLNKNYGVDAPIQNPEISQKIKNTVYKKYGVAHVLQNDEFLEKVKQTKISNGTINLYFGKTIPEWAKECEVPESVIYKYCISNTNTNEEDLVAYIKQYQAYYTDIEYIVKHHLDIDKWDKLFHKDLKYRPDFKLTDQIALNVDGLYWHSILMNSDQNYHFDMRKRYEGLDLRIIQFRADEIESKMDIIKSIIKNVYQQTQFKIGARKTELKKLSSQEAADFLNQNHIKGFKNAKHLGLYYQDELVSIMSYKTGKNKSFLKIERFCSKINWNVIGGFSKLLKAVQKDVGEIPIHYWVDLRYGTGNFLYNQGFKLEKETLGWEWTDFKRTYNRLKCRANMDKRRLTEKAYAQELGWVKIYDAGQRLFLLKK